MSQGSALVLTWAIELAVAVVLTGRRDPRLVVAVVVASLLTHPFVWWVGTSAPAGQWWARVLAIEAVVGVAEGFFIRVAAREPRGVFLGVAMNAVSFGVGLVLSPFLER